RGIDDRAQRAVGVRGEKRVTDESAHDGAHDRGHRRDPERADEGRQDGGVAERHDVAEGENTIAVQEARREGENGRHGKEQKNVRGERGEPEKGPPRTPQRSGAHHRMAAAHFSASRAEAAAVWSAVNCTSSAGASPSAAKASSSTVPASTMALRRTGNAPPARYRF